MNEELLAKIAASLAERVNAAVDIPLVAEEDEQEFFQLVILITLQLVLELIGFKGKVKPVKA